MSAFGRRLTLAIATGACAASLAGCAATESLGLNDYLPKKPEIFDRKVANTASRQEPFVQRLRYPVPDASWEREAASETEPWTLRR